uniref:Secretory peptide n=1 Tax=Heteropoda venatoria TaxID=152925 RepID=A0A088BPN2_HETVE|nr:secretory peptide [Heteropoda venatoria]
MKTTIIITLLIVALSAVVLAEESIEQAALDPETGRYFTCGYSYNKCTSDVDCCQNYECYKGSFCLSTRKDERL